MCLDRARTYGLLSRLYLHEVDSEQLQDLEASMFPTFAGDDDGEKGAALLVGYLDKAWENTSSELAVDYVRTFLGTGYDGCSAAYPYESVYTSEKHLLMQDAYTEVLATYRASGVVKATGTGEMVDHIGLELEFMQLLCTRQAEALNKDDTDAAWKVFDQQTAFLTRHLLRWAPALARDMARYSQTDFYRGLGLFTVGFLHAERDFLDETTSTQTQTKGA